MRDAACCDGRGLWVYGKVSAGMSSWIELHKRGSAWAWIAGWVRAGWVEWQDGEILGQGIGVMEVTARGGLSCSWQEAKLYPNPGHSPPLGTLPTITVGLRLLSGPHLHLKLVTWISTQRFFPPSALTKGRGQAQGPVLETSAHRICFYVGHLIRFRCRERE